MLEIHTIVKIVEPLKVKVIVESGCLDKAEQKTAYSIVLDSGAQCIKTSTGRCPDDNFLDKIDTVKFWKELGSLEIKASGGIKDWSSAQRFLESGADILGTSSGILIIDQQEVEEMSNN
jgi:deoxyribose-phosphate aldolase